MKEDTTLLLEKEVEKTVQKETKKELKKIQIEQKEKEIVSDLFSEKQEQDFIEKPNFDAIPENPLSKKRIIKIADKKNQSYHVNKKLKYAIFAIIICLTGAFCITTGIEISKTTAQLEQANEVYNASLSELLKKIYSTETGNRSLDLFETYPEDKLSADSFYESSNWFDKLCNYLSSLFGG